MTNKKMSSENKKRKRKKAMGAVEVECVCCVCVQEHQRNPDKVSSHLQLHPFVFPSCFLFPLAFVFTLLSPVRCWPALPLWCFRRDVMCAIRFSLIEVAKNKRKDVSDWEGGAGGGVKQGQRKGGR